jgi:diguanylate cyclase (GGDEF)-like protein
VQLLQSSTTFAGILPPVVVLPISALIYVLLNHIIVGSVQVFVCDISFEQSRVMTIDSLLPDFILACLGILMALLWTIDPWWIGLALLPLILMYQALHVPQLKQEAETDSKTGLTNARYFTKRAKALVAETARTSTSMALIMADLDYLRTINNTYGHLVGDIVIKGIADIIRETIRDQDIAARFGGEEFIIALPGSDLISAVALGERIRQLIEKTEFTLSSGEVIQATMSMGVACFPHDGSTLTDVTHAADIAVYHAKLLGRNRIVCAPDVPLKAKLDYLAANIDDQKPPAPEQTTLSATSRAPIAIADRIK